MARSGSSTQLGRRESGDAAQTRRALVQATIESLASDGFSGTSARVIASRAQCNQALVFYHFGSMAGLLLAALDAVSADRFARYGEAVGASSSLGELVGVAESVFAEDLDSGYATVLVELIAGARSIPGFGAEVAQRIAFWTEFARRTVDVSVDPALLEVLAPSSEIAYAVVAMYLGMEMLTSLDGDRTGAMKVFDRVRQVMTMLDSLGVAAPDAGGEPS